LELGGETEIEAEGGEGGYLGVFHGLRVWGALEAFPGVCGLQVHFGHKKP